MRPPPGPAGPGSCGNGLIAERSIKSFFATLKGELVEAVDYQTRDEARADLFQYIEGFYNRRRLPMGSATSHPSRRQQRSSQRLPPRSSVRESGASPGASDRIPSIIKACIQPRTNRYAYPDTKALDPPSRPHKGCQRSGQGPAPEPPFAPWPWRWTLTMVASTSACSMSGPSEQASKGRAKTSALTRSR